MASKTRWLSKLKRSYHGVHAKYFNNLSTSFLVATDHDRLNETNAALTLYERLCNVMEHFLAHGCKEMDLNLTNEQQLTIEKLVHCVKCRMNAIKFGPPNDWMTFTEIMKLKPVFKCILTWNSVFPIVIVTTTSTSVVSLVSDDSGVEEELSEEEEDTTSSQLLPRLPKQKGLTRMSIKIEKIGLKHTELIDPYITISVRDSASVHLTPLQNTTLPKSMESFSLSFDARCEIQKYVEKIPKGSAIFFELKHRKNGKIVTKCFAVLRRNEFKTVKGFLELYKGPTDYHLKNLIKLTKNKPLYLHLDVKLLDEN